MSKRYASRAALAAFIAAIVMTAGLAVARDADEVLGEMSEIMKAPGRAEQKRALLKEVAGIASISALDAAIAAMADKQVAGEARDAAGRIARSLMAPEQPAYLRRSAFMRWLGCQPDNKLAETLVEALRTSDFVRQSGAISTLRERGDSALLESVVGEITSLHADAQESLVEYLTAQADATASAALVRLAGHKDKAVAVKALAGLGRLGGEKALTAVSGALASPDGDMRSAALEALGAWVDDSPLPLLLATARKASGKYEQGLALRGIGALAPRAKSPAGRATLLDTLTLVAGSGSGAVTDDNAVMTAVQIAKVLAAAHPKESRQALDTLAARELGESARQHVRGALLLTTIAQLPNLARGAKVSSPDGFDTEGGSSGDAAAIDGNQGTYWDETDGHQLYRLRVDFPQATDVSAIAIWGWAHHNFSPRDFKVVCDEKTVKTVSNAVYVNNRLVTAFPRTRCTSLELQITGYYGGSPGIRELEIFDAP